MAPDPGDRLCFSPGTPDPDAPHLVSLAHVLGQQRNKLALGLRFPLPPADVVDVPSPKAEPHLEEAHVLFVGLGGATNGQIEIGEWA